MHSEYFNGFLIFLYPDQVLKQTVEKESAFEPLISLLMFSAVITPVSINIADYYALYDLAFPMPILLLAIFAVFFTLILLTAAVSFLFDWLYSTGIRIGKKNIKPDFLGSFCTHAYLMPAWFFLLIIYLFFPALKYNSLFQIAAVFMMIRLLDIESRLIKAVYNFRLIQSYVLVFLQMLLVVLGVSIGYSVKYIAPLLK
jgi:hypothetical protein